MAENPINGLMDTALTKIKEMIDVNTIVGSPITTIDGTTIIPVSKVTFGFASGGSEFSKSSNPPPENLFGGGSGAGVGLTPVAFLVVSDGNVKLLSIANNTSTIDRVIELVPEAIDKIESMIKGAGKKNPESESF